jgi:hypothetical protein
VPASACASIPVERKALPQWIAERLAAQGSASRAAAPGSRRWLLRRPRRGQPARRAPGDPEAGPALPAGELAFDQIEAAVLNVARYDVFKLGEAVLAGQTARALRMLDGLQAEGEAPVLVHWTLAEDIRGLKRVKDALGAGKPLPLALREARVWGAKERIFERAVTLLSDATLAHLLEAAQVCDGLVKGCAPGVAARPRGRRCAGWCCSWSRRPRAPAPGRRFASPSSPRSSFSRAPVGPGAGRGPPAPTGPGSRPVARGLEQGRCCRAAARADRQPDRADRLAGVAPPGPAMPVTAIEKAAGERAARLGHGRRDLRLTAPCAAIVASGTPSISALAAFE